MQFCRHNFWKLKRPQYDHSCSKSSEGQLGEVWRYGRISSGTMKNQIEISWMKFLLSNLPLLQLQQLYQKGRGTLKIQIATKWNISLVFSFISKIYQVPSLQRKFIKIYKGTSFQADQKTCRWEETCTVSRDPLKRWCILLLLKLKRSSYKNMLANGTVSFEQGCPEHD